MNLAKVFNNGNDNMLLKGNYPHDFINSVGLEKGLSYKGDVPDKIYFNNISVDDYNEIVNRINKLFYCLFFYIFLFLVIFYFICNWIGFQLRVLCCLCMRQTLALKKQL